MPAKPANRPVVRNILSDSFVLIDHERKFITIIWLSNGVTKSSSKLRKMH